MVFTMFLKSNTSDPHELEMELILGCLRRRIDATIRQRVRELCGRPLDWNFIYWILCWQGLRSLFACAIEKICPEAIPAQVLTRLKSDYGNNVSHNLLLTNELLRLLRAFSEHGIDVIVYKGPLQAAKIYHNMACRDISDLDFVVRKRDMARIDEILHHYDYYFWAEAVKGCVRFDEYMKDGATYDCPYIRKDRAFHIEVHWRVLGELSEYGVNAEYLWDHVVPTSYGGAKFYEFTDDMKFLLMSIHNEKHDWRELKFICDVAWMLENCPQMCIESVFEESVRLNRSKSFLKTLFLAQTLLDAPLPEKMRARISTRPDVKREAAVNEYQMFKNGFCLPFYSEWRRIMRRDAYFGAAAAVGQGGEYSFWHYLLAILTPQYEDRKILPRPLPRQFEGVYLISRVLRFFKYWLVLHKRVKLDAAIKF